MSATCSSCPFFDRFATDALRGWCRESAPQTREKDDAVITYWPDVHAEYDWCGKHPQREEPPRARMGFGGPR